MVESVENSRLRFACALLVALSITGVEAGRILAAIGDQRTADFIRSVSMPGSAPADIGASGPGAGAAGWAVAGMVLGVAVLIARSRVWFTIAGIWLSLGLASAFAVWTAASPRLETSPIGPLTVSMAFTGVLLATASVAGITASVVGWLVSPPEPDRPVFMPPMWHQN
jgi:hypothetical protein